MRKESEKDKRKAEAVKSMQARGSQAWCFHMPWHRHSDIGPRRRLLAAAKRGARSIETPFATSYTQGAINGVHGRLADLGKVTERQFRLALTMAMNKDMDSVVVENEEAAKQCIQVRRPWGGHGADVRWPGTVAALSCPSPRPLLASLIALCSPPTLPGFAHLSWRSPQFLKDERVPPMTFIPLASIAAKPANEQLRTLGDGTRLAIDCIGECIHAHASISQYQDRTAELPSTAGPRACRPGHLTQCQPTCRPV